MTVMRRNGGWAFAAWVPDGERGRRQVWRSGFRTKAEAAAAERRFLVELEDGANQVAVEPRRRRWRRSSWTGWTTRHRPGGRRRRSATTSSCASTSTRTSVRSHSRHWRRPTSVPGTPPCCASPSAGEAVNRCPPRPCALPTGCCAGRCRTRCGGSSSTATLATPSSPRAEPRSRCERGTPNRLAPSLRPSGAIGSQRCGGSSSPPACAVARSPGSVGST